MPVNPYGLSKLAFEETLDGCRAKHAIRSIRFRYFNVAGAWPDAIDGRGARRPRPTSSRGCWAHCADGQERFEVFGGDYPTPDGTCVRDYIHVLDLAEAHRLGLEALVSGHAGGVYNLGNGAGLQQPRGRSHVRRGQRSGRCHRHRSAPCRAILQCWSPPPRRREPNSDGGRSGASLTDIVGDAWRWHLEHPDGYR